MLTNDDDGMRIWRLSKVVPPGDWVIQGIIPSVVLGWGLWISSWLGAWLGLCGLLYFILLHVYYPVQGRTHAECGRLLPGVGALCGCGVLAGIALALIVTDGSTGGVILGLFMGLFALPIGFVAAVLLSIPFARRFGVAPESPVVELDPTKWPDPPPSGGMTKPGQVDGAVHRSWDTGVSKAPRDLAPPRARRGARPASRSGSPAGSPGR